MKILYKDWNPKASALILVDAAEQVIEEYEGMGYTLTLRQLYYQFVARGIVENTERSYKNVGVLITKARMAGLISWEAIEDRNREHVSFWFDEDILNPIRDLPDYIRFDRWDRQDNYVEVWVEKEALGNVVSKACRPFFVPHLSCKGYLSASEAWRAGRRLKKKIEQGKICTILHLGDHDPSGIDMSRDNQDRLDLFSGHESLVNVKRIALNIDQVEEHNPPPNPAKLTDSRAKQYVRRHGRSSWELDALEPRILERLITNEIESLIDPQVWQETEGREEEEKEKLEAVYDRWPEIAALLKEAL